MNKPKRQHFVTKKVLLQRFTDEEGCLYFYDKRFPKKGIQKATPNNLFVERYLYTLYLYSGEKDFSGEEELSRLEGKSNGIIEKIVTMARSGRVPYLTSSEKGVFDRFFYFQWKRVPDFLDEKLPDHRLEKIIDDVVEYHEASGGALSPEVQDMKNNPRTVSRIRHNIRAMAAVGPSEAMAAAASDEESLRRLAEVEKESLRRLAEMGFIVVATYDPNGSFIIGSRPILEIRDPEQSPDSDPSDMLLPLASDVAVQPYYFSYLSEGQVELTTASSSFIWEVNKAIMEQSTLIAGRSYELIASLVDGVKPCNHETSTQSNRLVGPGGRIYFR